MFGLFKKKKISDEKMDRLFSMMMKDIFGDKTSGVKIGVDFGLGDDRTTFSEMNFNPINDDLIKNIRKSMGIVDKENLCDAEKQLIGIIGHLREVETKLNMLASANGMNFVTHPPVPAQPERPAHIELVKMEVNNPKNISKNK